MNKLDWLVHIFISPLVVTTNLTATLLSHFPAPGNKRVLTYIREKYNQHFMFICSVEIYTMRKLNLHGNEIF